MHCSTAFDALAAWKGEIGTSQLYYWSGKWEAALERFIIGKITASHYECGSNIKRQADLDAGGKSSVNSLAASTVIVGERLRKAGCLLFGSDRARLKGGHRDTVQLLSVMRRAWDIPNRSAKFHHCLLQKLNIALSDRCLPMFVWRELWKSRLTLCSWTLG